MADTAASAPASVDTSIGSGGEASETPSALEKSPKDEPWRKVKHKYKAAGEEYEVDYDELVKRAEKSHGAEKRLAEASKKEKAVEAEMKRLQKLRDPKNEDLSDLIELVGFDKAKKFADKLVWDQIQWDELPEHEKRRVLAESERDNLRSDLEKRQAEDQAREQQRLYNEADRVISDEISRVLKDAKAKGLSVADIPEAKDLIVDEMLGYLNYMDKMEAKGLPITSPPPSHEDVLNRIQEKYDTSSGAYIKRLSVEKLRVLLSKEQLEGLRQAEIDQLYAPTPSQGRSHKTNSKDQTVNPPRRKGEKVKTKTDDFFANMDKRFGG